MKKILFSVVLTQLVATLSFAAAPKERPCANGWPAFALCSNDPDVTQMRFCLDPSKKDGSLVIHTLDVKTKRITEEVGTLIKSEEGIVVLSTPQSTTKYFTLMDLPYGNGMAFGFRTDSPSYDVELGDRMICGFVKRP